MLRIVITSRIINNSMRMGAMSQSVRGFAAAPATEAKASNNLTINFTTPYAPILKNKVVDKVTLPGESGEYGVTANHSPIISQLAPGVVTVFHVSGENDQYFVPGGFAITHANSVTDITVPEAFKLADFSPEAVKAGLDAAKKAEATASDDVTKATAIIEVKTYSNLARALGLTV